MVTNDTNNQNEISKLEHICICCCNLDYCYNYNILPLTTKSCVFAYNACEDYCGFKCIFYPCWIITPCTIIFDILTSPIHFCYYVYKYEYNKVAPDTIIVQPHIENRSSVYEITPNN